MYIFVWYVAFLRFSLGEFFLRNLTTLAASFFILSGDFKWILLLEWINLQDDVIPRFDIAELLVAEGGSTHEDGHGAAQLYDESTNDDSDHVETERDDERNNNEPNLPFFTGGGTAPSQESGSQLSQRERGSSDSWPEEESSRSTASMQAQGLRRRILSRPTQASSTEPSSEGVNSGNTTTGPSVSSEETANSISERRARAAEAAERRRIG